MVALYVTSQDKGSGKTVVCAGLGNYLQNDGKKVGYLKPVSGDNPADDTDAAFMKQILSLHEETDVLNPDLQGKSGLKEAFDKVAKDKDVVIIEGEFASVADAAATLNARVIVVEPYSVDLARKAESYINLGKALLGIVINKVPLNRVAQARSEGGQSVIGVISDERVLIAPTLGELNERINGEVLSGAEKSDELVEAVMLGALAVDHGPLYYERKENKMVVLRSDRPDMQMAAMETSTRGMVIVGNTPINPVVMARAEEKGVPVIVTKDSTAKVAETIEEAWGDGKFKQWNKMPRLGQLIEHDLDLSRITTELGI